MKPGLVRIIAGKWRGRKLKVPSVIGLRPTPDRVRETVFNWLTSVIQGAYCLDLFCGTGVLGFEALSRGAKYVVMVDQSEKVIKLLQEELILFGVDNAYVYRADIPLALDGLIDHISSAQDKMSSDQAVTRFDVVFIDPPYQKNLLIPSCFFLEEHGFLADSAHIYLEAQRFIKGNELPANWQLVKAKRAGQVFYHLVCRKGNSHDKT